MRITLTHELQKDLNYNNQEYKAKVDRMVTLGHSKHKGYL